MNATLEEWFAGWVSPLEAVRADYGNLEPGDMTPEQLVEVADALKVALDGLKEDHRAWRHEARAASR